MNQTVLIERLNFTRDLPLDLGVGPRMLTANFLLGHGGLFQVFFQELSEAFALVASALHHTALDKQACGKCFLAPLLFFRS